MHDWAALRGGSVGMITERKHIGVTSSKNRRREGGTVTAHEGKYCVNQVLNWKSAAAAEWGQRSK
jgi:hypothetical protein